MPRPRKQPLTVDHDMRYWLLTCRTQKELEAIEFLRSFGYWAWSPMEARYKKQSRHVRGKTDRVWFQVAALPGYLIVGFGAGGPSWALMLNERNKRPALGIVPLIVNDAPVRIRSSDVQKLQEIERDEWLNPPGYRKHQIRGREYDVGDEVEVVEGPLSGYTARVSRIEDGYAVLDIQILGKNPKVEQDMLAKTG